MFPIYDSSHGTLRRIKIVDEYLTGSQRNINDRLFYVKNEIAKKTGIPPENQIILSPHGEEICNVKDLNNFNTTENPVCVFTRSDDFYLKKSVPGLERPTDVEEEILQLQSKPYGHLSVEQISALASSLHKVDDQLDKTGQDWIADCRYIIYSIIVAKRNLDLVRNQYQAHLTRSNELFTFYKEKYKEIQTLIRDTDGKISDLDDFKMPFGLTKTGDEMSALEYLESETDISKTFEEILDASKENFNRTLLSKTLEIHKKFSDLLHQPIKTHEELVNIIDKYEEEHKIKIDKLNREQSGIRNSIELTASSSFSVAQDYSSSNSQLRIMLNNHSAIRSFTDKCMECKKKIYLEAKSIVKEIFSRQTELYYADSAFIKLVKRISRIKDYYEVLKTIPRVEEVQSAIDEIFIQTKFFESYSSWHKSAATQAESCLIAERARRASLSNSLDNPVLKKISTIVVLPDNNTDNEGIPKLVCNSALTAFIDETRFSKQLDFVKINDCTKSRNSEMLNLGVQTSNTDPLTISANTMTMPTHSSDMAVSATVCTEAQATSTCTLIEFDSIGISAEPEVNSVSIVTSFSHNISNISTQTVELVDTDNSDEYESRISDLEKSLVSSRFEINAFEIKLEQMDSLIVEFEKSQVFDRNKSAALLQLNDALTRKIEELKLEKTEIIQSGEVVLQKTKNELDSAVHINTELKSSIDNITSQNVTLNEKNDYLEQSLKEMSDKVNELSDKLSAQIITSQLKERKLEEQLEQLKEKNEKASSSWEMLKDALIMDIDRLKSDNDHLKIELKTLEADSSKNEAVSEKLKLSLSKEQEKQEELKTKLQVAQNRVMNLEVENQQLLQKQEEMIIDKREADIKIAMADVLQTSDSKAETSLEPVTRQPSSRMIQSTMGPSIDRDPIPSQESKLMTQSLYISPSQSTEPLYRIDRFDKNDPVCVVFNAEHGHYVLLTSHSTFYFLHENCLESLDLVPPSELENSGNGESIRRYGIISEKPMHCVTRRSNNRFKIPEGTRFYRVKVKPHL